MKGIIIVCALVFASVLVDLSDAKYRSKVHSSGGTGNRRNPALRRRTTTTTTTTTTKAPTMSDQDIADLEKLLDEYGIDYNSNEEEVNQVNDDFFEQYVNDLEQDVQNVKKDAYHSYDNPEQQQQQVKKVNYRR